MIEVLNIILGYAVAYFAGCATSVIMLLVAMKKINNKENK